MPVSRQDDSIADEFVWTWIDTTTDKSEEVTNKSIQYDNGVFVSNDFENGQIVFKLKQDKSLDGALKKWDSVSINYGEEGNVTSKTKVLDNGITKNIFYAATGEKLVVSNDSEIDGGVKNWDISLSFFDDDGDIEYRLSRMDSGDFKFVMFDEDGSRERKLTIDIDDSHDWYMREVIFNEDGSKTYINYSEDDLLPEEYLEIKDLIIPFEETLG